MSDAKGAESREWGLVPDAKGIESRDWACAGC